MTRCAWLVLANVLTLVWLAAIGAVSGPVAVGLVVVLLTIVASYAFDAGEGGASC